MSEPVKLFIVEGESRDYRFINVMTKCFFKGRYKTRIINLPAAQNIYMLYQKLLFDDFQTDVVEVLRDNVKEADKILANIKRQDIDEVYLFFDYDVHQNNLRTDNLESSKAIVDMLEIFDNETENGKLYISYPMVEALYDYRSRECQSFSKCFIDLDKVKDYKNISADGNLNANSRFDTIEEWENIINIFYLRIRCLFGLSAMDFKMYRNSVSTKSIYELEKKINDLQKQVFVLSALPEFLLDNFKANFFNSMISLKKFNYVDCPKKYNVI